MTIQALTKVQMAWQACTDDLVVVAVQWVQAFVVLPKPVQGSTEEDPATLLTLHREHPAGTAAHVEARSVIGNKRQDWE